MTGELHDRWLGALSSLPSFAERLNRGHYYASRGQVSDLEVAPGRVSGKVLESRARRPDRATYELPVWDEATWHLLLTELSGELRATAAVLAGELPDDLEERAARHGVELFPTDPTGTCTCTERQPCRHVASLHHAFARGLDDDPFQLLELRGKGRRTLVATLRSLRSGSDSGASPGTLPIDDLAGVDLHAARGDLDEVTLSPHPVEDGAWLLEQLGPPPGVEDPDPFARRMADAADFAWRIAAGEGAGAADEELLLAELRAQRMATAGSIADALGWDVDTAREALDELFSAGRVLRTGSGERTRYRAGMA